LSAATRLVTLFPDRVSPVGRSAVFRPAGLMLFLIVLVGLLVPELQRLSSAPRPSPATIAVAAPASASRHGYRIELAADARGHFAVEASIDGHRLPMLVDTGATLVALRLSDARALGLAPLPGDYTVSVSTANGRVAAARVHLRELAVRDVVVNNLDALVLPDAALDTDLLGMNFFNRLSRFEIADRRLILEQ
jgi:aspartyl protease family protein